MQCSVLVTYLVHQNLLIYIQNLKLYVHQNLNNYDDPLLSNSDESSSNPILTENAESELPTQEAKNNLHIKEVSEVDLKFTNAEKPNIKQCVKYKIVDSNDTTDAPTKGRVGTSTCGNKNWFKIKSLVKNTLSLVNWGIEETFFSTSSNTADIEKAMLEELGGWKDKSFIA